MEKNPAIEAELQRLEKLIPGLKAESDTKAALERFAEASAPLTRNAPAEQEAYITQRLTCMLVDAGQVAGDPEGEPCVRGDEAEPPDTPRGGDA